MTTQPPYLDAPDALVTAADQGHYEFVRALLAGGADPNMTNAFGDTALIAAARHGHTQIVDLLMGHGADVDAEDRDGDTALSVATYYGQDDVIRLLSEHGARKPEGPSAKELMIEALNHKQRPGGALVRTTAARLPSAIMADPYWELSRLSEALAHRQTADGLWRSMVESSRAMLGADGCTFYVVRDQKLHVEVLLSQSLNMRLDAAGGRGRIADPTPIFRPDGDVDESSLAAVCAATCAPVNVPDVRNLPSWTRARLFDERTGYHTVSVLNVPVVSRGHVFGVLQFINALDADGRVGPFNAQHESIAHSVATLMSLAQLIFGASP